MSASAENTSINLLTQEVASVVRREPVVCEPTDSVQSVAQLMRERRVSSALMMRDGEVQGIVTDRDLRNRVLAEGLDASQLQVSEIATLSPITLAPQTPVFEALMLMTRHNIHHLPIISGQHIHGVVTATSLTEQYSASPVFLAGQIYQQDSVEALKAVTSKVLHLVRSLVESDASAYSVGHIVTSITDALTTRLIQLAERQLGPAPVPFVWVAAGSQARSEQTAKSDQDNCMIIGDAYDEAQHGAYFKALSRSVCDGLDACGYVYCPGEMMAMTDAWRLPLRDWKRLFTKWIEQPEPKALMYTSVFFDLRAISGSVTLLHELRHQVIDMAQKNGIFLSHLVGNALMHRPALGIFGQLKTQRNVGRKKTIDLKHHGLVTIVDLARVYALATGVDAVNTHDRLLAVANHGSVSGERAHDLRDALEFVAHIRLQHQARQIAKGEAPDNFIAPNELSDFEREHLRHAFRVVAKLQEVLAQRYQPSR